MDEHATHTLGNMSELGINSTVQPSLEEQASQLLMYRIAVTSLKYWLPITSPFGIVGKSYTLLGPCSCS